METQVYNQKGKAVGSLALPEAIFGLSWNADLVHQVVTAMQANARTPIAHTKFRGEVSGTGKKPWKQKGTGRARHGSQRSPIWRGGGITHGPRNDKSYEQKINKKMAAKALFTVLSEKARKGQILFVDEIVMSKIKTKDGVEVLNNFKSIKGFEKMGAAKNKKGIYLTVPAKSENIKKSFANIKSIEVDEVRNMNPVDLLAYRFIIMAQPKESFAFLGGKLEKKVAKK